MGNPILSVLVPVYNVEKYLNKCLDSIISQTYKDFEIVCVNDGSTDGSLNILQEFKEKYNGKFIIVNQENKGSLVARKSAVMTAEGKYSIFIDSDDWLTSNDSLEVIMDIVQKEECDIVRFSPDIYGEGFEIWDIKRYIKAYKNSECSFSDRNLIELVYRLHVIDWTLLFKVYKSEILKKSFTNMENLRVSMCEDVYSSVFISYFSRTYKSVTTKPLYTYRIGTGISTKKGLSLENFLKYVESMKTVDSLRNFFISVNTEADYSYVVDFMKERVVDEIFGAIAKVDEEDLKPVGAILSENIDLKNFLLDKYSALNHAKYKFLRNFVSGEKKARYERKSRLFENLKILKRYIS